MLRRKKMFLLFLVIMTFGMIITNYIVQRFWLFIDYNREYISPSFASLCHFDKKVFNINTKPLEETEYFSFNGIKIGLLPFPNETWWSVGNEGEREYYAGDIRVTLRTISYREKFITVNKLLPDWNRLIYEDIFSDEVRYNEIDKGGILDKYNVTNDYSFLCFLAENVNRENTIFTKSEIIVENYAIKYFSSAINHFGHFPDGIFESYKLSGDYEGFVIKQSTSMDYFIFKNNKLYFFSFSNSSFDYQSGYRISKDIDEEEIKNIMNTVIIE